MIRKTLWKPDTCDCAIEYEWDDTTPPETRTHTISRVEGACDAHKALTASGIFDAVKNENTRKNKLLSEIVNNTPTLSEDTIAVDGTTVKALKKGVNYSFSFDNNRVLQVQFSGVSLTQPQKNTLQTLADTKFGSGLIKIN